MLDIHVTGEVTKVKLINDHPPQWKNALVVIGVTRSSVTRNKKG